MSGKIKSDIDTLWETFLTGDDKAFAGIYYAFINPLLTYGKKLTLDTAMLQDALQEVFMDLYQKRNKLHTPISNLKSYLFIALKNNLVKRLLQNRKFEDKEVDDSAMGEFNIEYSFLDQQIIREISEEKRMRLQRAIVSLSSGQKEIIYLKFEEDLGYKEIAVLMNVTVESARKQLYRALLSLRETIDNESFEIFLSFFIKKRFKKLSMLGHCSDHI
jgi:RNA polymerase sigma factor (sigma-70 family)